MCVCSGVDSTMNSIKHVYGGNSRGGQLKGGGGGGAVGKKINKLKGAVSANREDGRLFDCHRNHGNRNFR